MSHMKLVGAFVTGLTVTSFAACRPVAAIPSSSASVDRPDIRTGTSAGGDAASPGMTIDQTLEFREIVSAQLAPDGKLVAYVTRRANQADNQYVYEICLAPVDGGGLTTTVEASEADDLQWTPDSRWVLFTARVQGEMQVYRLSPRGRAAEPVTKHPGGLEDGSDIFPTRRMFQISRDGSRVVFVTWENLEAEQELARSARDGWIYDGRVTASDIAAPTWRLFPARAQLWLQDLRSGQVSRLWASDRERVAPSSLPEFAWSPDGRAVAVLHAPNQANLKDRRYVGLIDVATRTFRTELTGIGWTTNLSWLDDSTLSLSSEGPIDAGERRYNYAWYEYNLSTRRLSRASHPPQDSTAMLRDEIKPVTGERVSKCTFDITGHRAVCIRQGPITPPDLVSLEVQNGHIRGQPLRLTDLNPELRTVTLGEVRTISWTLGDGTSGTSGLILPVGYRPGQRYPLLLMLYNLFKEGEFIYQAGWNTSWPAQAFAARGYAVVLMNVPARSRAPGNLLEAKQAEIDRPVVAVKEVVRQTVAQGFADASRLGILGWSYGAFIVNYLISRYPDMFHAAASSEGGLYNPSLYWWNSNAGRVETDSVVGGGPYPRWWSNWLQISPVPCAHRIRIPILMEFANRHTLALELYTAVTSQGGQAELIFYSNETHVFSAPRHRYVSMWRNYDWFNFWLLDAKDPDPKKVAQYLRWEAMKQNLEPTKAAANSDDFDQEPCQPRL